jgi:hypothetical protein
MNGHRSRNGGPPAVTPPRRIRMNRKLLPIILAAAAAAVAACSSSASSSTSASATSAAASAPPATASAKPLAPLKIGNFPSTTDGTLARNICKAWSGLRSEYAAKLAAGTLAYALNQWFSSTAWSTVQNDGMKLGNDPAYSNIETASGLIITGDAASTANAAQLDKACENAN